MDANEIRQLIWAELSNLFIVTRPCPKCKDVTMQIRLLSSNPAKQNQVRCMRCLTVFGENFELKEIEDESAGK
jgi:hypothetical protein